MEKIVLEVDERVEKASRDASPDRRRNISGKMNVQLSRELFAYNKEAFLSHLEELRATMAERGLTEDALADILKDEL